MNRRDFLKSSLGAALGLSLPIEISAILTIVDIKLLDSFKEILKFGGTRIVDDQWVMDITVDIKALWQYVRLVDSEGRKWHTDDQGVMWRCGLMEFSLGLEEQEGNEY